MKFRDLIISLADQIGRHHLPVVDNAHEISDFLGDDAIHHDVVKKIVRSVYRANQCGHLNAEVSATATFDAIGKIHGELLRSENSDIEVVRLMAQIGEHTGELLSQTNPGSSVAHVSQAESVQCSTEHEDSGSVHRFSAAQIDR